MAGVLLLRLLGGHVGSQGMAAADDTGLLKSMLVPGAWRELWARGCRVAILVPRVWRELWAWGCGAAILVPGAWQVLWARSCLVAM